MNATHTNNDASLSQNSEELEAIFIASTKETSRRVHSCAVINWIIGVCRLKDNKISAIIAGIVLSISTWCVGWLINRMVCSPISLAEAKGLVAGSLLVGLAYWIIHFLHDITLKVNRENIAKLAADENGLKALHQWFEKRFSMRSQIGCSLATAILAVISVAYFLEGVTGAENNSGIYVTVFSGMFAVGNGIYCCLKCPTLTKPIVEHPIRLYPYDPASTASVQAFIAIFGKLSLGCGFIVTVIMLLMAFVRPWQNQMKLIPALIWLILGWGAVTYCFVFPLLLLSKIIRQEKQAQLKKLEEMIRKRTLQTEIEKLPKEDFENLMKLIELRNSIAKTRDIAIDIAALRNYLSSLILPLVSFLIANRAIFSKLLRL